MKSLKMAGLVLAVFAMSMVAAASASAVQTKPYMIQCRETKGTGSWEESQCQKAKSTGKWETREAGALGDETFSSTSGVGKLETASGTTVECKHDLDEGKIKDDKHFEKVRIRFFECESGGAKCNSAGANAGEIITSNLKGELGYINEPNKEVGLLLEPEAGGLFAEFKCSIVTIKVRGAVIGRITPVNKMTTQFFLCFEKAAGKGIQNPLKFEGGAEKTLETETSLNPGVFEKSAIETQAQIELQFDAEIRA